MRATANPIPVPSMGRGGATPRTVAVTAIALVAALAGADAALAAAAEVGTALV